MNQHCLKQHYYQQIYTQLANRFRFRSGSEVVDLCNLHNAVRVVVMAVSGLPTDADDVTAITTSILSVSIAPKDHRQRRQIACYNHKQSVQTSDCLCLTSGSYRSGL